MTVLKRLAARLPRQWQAELKRIYFGRQIARDVFNTSEQEYTMLPDLVEAGDWVIDIGANIGQYTKRLSDLVGPSGRVFSFEPIPATFALLAANTQRFANANVTLFNMAASAKLAVVGMSIPRFTTGLDNYYEAHVDLGADAAMHVLTLPVDALAIDRRVSLVKIDAEGHEASVLAGMQKLLDRFKPVLIVETGSAEIIRNLLQAGYRVDRATGSSNVVCRP